MKTINVPSKNDVDEKSAAIFEQLQSALGFVPNLYAVTGYSSDSLERFLNFSTGAGKESFSAKEIEAIKLAVSEANNCDYCKAAHTALAKSHGFSEEETIEIRAAIIADSRLNALTSIAREIAFTAGKVSRETKEAFFAENFDEKALVDLVAVVSSVTFTNYLFGLSQIEVDFPKARKLEVVAA